MPMTTVHLTPGQREFCSKYARSQRYEGRSQRLKQSLDSNVIKLRRRKRIRWWTYATWPKVICAMI